MKFSVFADESGTHSDFSCYCIGALVIPNDKIDFFNTFFTNLKKNHKIVHEIKWYSIQSSYNIINFGIDLFKFIISNNFKLSFIVVRKATYRKWRTDEEKAFYMTYSMLFTNKLRLQRGEYSVYIDDRSDSYSKHDEVVHKICNYVLKNDKTASRVSTLEKIDSKISSGIQAVDIFTGAISTSHNLYLDENTNCNKGKLIFIEKIASILGWDKLCYDTMPYDNPNIWHFPFEGYRAIPATLPIKFNNEILHISKTDIEN